MTSNAQDPVIVAAATDTNHSTDDSESCEMSPTHYNTTPKARPHLPTEIWGCVLEKVDDPFTLWVTCRQVSRTFRAEGERAFRNVFLPALRIKWTRGGYTRGSTAVNAQLVPESCKTDTSLARLEITTNDPWIRASSSDETWVAWIRETMDYKDVNFRHRQKQELSSDTPYHTQMITFYGNGHFANTAEIPDLEYRRAPGTFDSIKHNQMKHGEISFNWKSLMNRLFVEETYVRRGGLRFQEIERTDQDLKGMIAKAVRSATGSYSFLKSAAEAQHQVTLTGVEAEIAYSLRVSYFHDIGNSLECTVHKDSHIKPH